MPSVIELHLFLLVHPLDPETDQQLVENQPVERVELAPWQMTPADLNGWLGHGPSVLPWRPLDRRVPSPDKGWHS